MPILNIFFQYFKKQKFKKFQMFLQIFISLLCVLLLIGMVLNVHNKLKEIESITSLNNIKGNFFTDNSYISDPQIETDNLKNLTSDIRKFNGIKFNLFTVQSGGLDNGYTIHIDSNMNDSIKFPIIKGRNFNKDDFKLNYEDKNTIIPIIISKNLEQQHPLGSEFKTKHNAFVNENNYLSGGPTVKVVGVLDNSAKFWLKDTTLVDELNFFDTIIYPLDFKRKPDIIVQYFINLNCSKDEYNNIKKEIEAKYPGIKLIDSDLKSLFFEKLEDRIIELIFISIFTIVLFITSLFGFISIIQSIILMRKKELGVYYCLGASKKNILLFILMEIVIISLLAAFICFISVYKFKDYFMYNFEVLLNKNTFLISLLIISIYILISSLVVLITILKKNPVELIKN